MRSDDLMARYTAIKHPNPGEEAILFYCASWSVFVLLLFVSQDNIREKVGVLVRVVTEYRSEPLVLLSIQFNALIIYNSIELYRQLRVLSRAALCGQGFALQTPPIGVIKYKFGLAIKSGPRIIVIPADNSV